MQLRMNQGIVVWLWLVICLAEVLVAKVGAGGDRDAWFKTTMVSTPEPSVMEDQQLQYVPTRPRRKHRYIDTDEKKSDVALSNPSDSRLDQNHAGSISSQEDSVFVSQSNKGKTDTTQPPSNANYAPLSSFESFDEMPPSTRSGDTQSYLKNITELVYYYKEQSIYQASKRRSFLDTLLQTQEDNRYWRDNYVTLKDRYGRLLESKAVTELKLALIVARMRNLTKSSLLNAADRGLHIDQSVPFTLLHKLLPKGFLSQVKATQDHFDPEFTHHDIIRDELVNSYQLSLDDRDAIIHLLTVELEALQRHSDHWNQDMLSLSERGTELEEEIFRLTMEIRELKREQEMLESKEALLNSTLTRTMDENLNLQAEIDRYSDIEESLQLRNDKWKGFTVTFALNSKIVLDRLELSNKLVDERTEELRHVTEQLSNATAQLGQMHMSKLPQLPTPEPVATRKCIFAKFFYGK